MIVCDRCKREIDKDLIECIEVDVIGEDLTDIKSDANIFRYCLKCWDEMITFLLSEGKL